LLLAVGRGLPTLVNPSPAPVRESRRLTYLLASPTGGMHFYTADLAGRAAQGRFGTRVDVSLVTSASYPARAYSPLVNVRTPVTCNGTGFSREGLSPGGVRRILREIDALAPEVVHLTGVHAWNVLLLGGLRRRGISVIHTLHDLEPHSGVGFRSLIGFWNDRVLHSGAHILVHGRRYRDAVMTRGVPADRVTYAPLLHGFWQHGALDRFEAGGPPPGREAVALFFGRIEAYKGVETLLEAWSLGGDLGFSARWRLIVAGRRHESIRLPTSPDGVELRDRYIGDEEAFDLFRSSSVLVLPYHDASQSALIAAAYRFGMPVIVTRTGALAEYVIGGETGWVVPPQDPIALAAAIREALSDLGRTSLMGERCREWYNRTRLEEEQILTRLYSG
jgi:glycosyltransferase involved in cell wall biosynthesis